MPLLKPAGAEKLGLACAAKYSPETIVAPYVQHGLTALASWFNAKMNDFERLHHLNSVTDDGAIRGRCTKSILLFARGTSEFDLAGLGKVGRALAKRLRGDGWSMVSIPTMPISVVVFASDCREEW